MGKSPVIKSRMDFGKALKELTTGKKIRRVDWPNDGTYLVLSNNTVHIWRPDDKLLHPLFIASEDILAEDWVIV